MYINDHVVTHRILMILVVAILSSIYIVTAVDQQVSAQTGTITVNYSCINNQAMGTINLSGFPEGNTILTRSDLPTSSHLGTFIVPSSGEYTFPSSGPDLLIQGTFTFTAFSDPNHNSIMDPGEFVVTTTQTISCSSPPDAGSKVIICHIPPGNPGNPQTIEVNRSAVQSHINNHGDHLGPCD